jgi:hypothetical protein
MATLFFEGFDKGIIFNQLDPNYWSTQFNQYPKYAFGGYLPDNFGYTYNSPNGGFLPSGAYRERQGGGSSPFFPGTNYPGFGSPPGFLAFSNIEIEDSSTVEYPTYLQASGFSSPSGDVSYLNMRCLGLESKNTNYSEYPYRHTLFSYNSGDIPQLTVNIVKITGTTNLIPINGKNETLALEIQQHNNTLGYFDLNIVNNITGYRIASVYNSNNTILTPAHTISSSERYASLISRWTHLEFSVDESQEEPTIFINAEDINLPVINFDNNINREDWEIGLPISGFKFDNLRFYNRTYSSSIVNDSTFPHDPNWFIKAWGNSYYYMFGKNWLLDDLVLIDSTNPEPSYWLGSTARVSQLAPGVSGQLFINSSIGNVPARLIDNAIRSDGIRDWTTNSTTRLGNSSTFVTSHRKALSYLDNDINSIEAINSGSLNALAFSPRQSYVDNGSYFLYDNSSAWRETLNEAIGGVKIYNSARKQFLDTSFVNVFRSGVSDPLEDSVSLLLHCNNFPIVDSTKIPKLITNNNTIIREDNFKFSDGSLYFNNSNSYLSLNHSDLANNPFTIECWIYFNNHNQAVSLFNKIPGSFPSYPNSCIRSYYGFSASTIGVSFIRGDNCDKTLLFSSIAQTGVWNHLAIVRTTGNALRCFLNGVSNTGYIISDCDNRLCYGEVEGNGAFQRESQGVFQGTYNLNFLSNPNITAASEVTDTKIGLPKQLSTTDEYFNNVSLLIKSDQLSIIDLSSSSKTINNNGIVFSNDVSRFGYKSLYLTGGKTLSFGNSDDLNFGTNDFSIEFWFYINSLSSNATYNIFSSNNLNMRLKTGQQIYAGPNDPWIQLWSYDSSNNKSYLFKTTGGYYSMGAYFRDGLAFNTNQWYYSCITKYAGDLFAYIVPQRPGVYEPYNLWPLHILKNDSVHDLSFDYAYINANSNTYNNFPINFNGFTIGDSNTNLTHNLYIDNFRVTKGLARIPTRLNAPVSATKESFGVSLPDENVNNSAYIDEYRITYGANRYDRNFTPPNQPFKVERDDYYPLGPEYTTNKTSYKTFQHYALKNPATNKSWTLPEISGMTLGVKKL